MLSFQDLLNSKSGNLVRLSCGRPWDRDQVAAGTEADAIMAHNSSKVGEVSLELGLFCSFASNALIFAPRVLWVEL